MKLRCCHLGILSALAALGVGACVGPPAAASGDMGTVTASLQLSQIHKTWHHRNNFAVFR